MDGLVHTFTTAVQPVIDKHAPVLTIRDKHQPLKPWYNDDIRNARVERRRLERKFLKSGLTVDKDLFQVQQDKVVQMIKTAKLDYWKNELLNADTKKMFSLVNGLNGVKCSPLPRCDSNKQLANAFCDFFINKICRIREELDIINQPHNEIDSSICVKKLDHFATLTECELGSLINSLKSSSCELDSCPSWLLKQHVAVVLPHLLRIINISLLTGNVPKTFKHGLLKPLLTKPSLDSEMLKNYRPITNIPFLSKILKKVVAKQLTNHMSKYGLHDCFQSAYRPGHSTETVLLTVKDYMQSAFDNREGILLVMLDMSAAFDTLNHAILLKHLETEVGLSAITLKWFTSYLSERTQSVTIKNEFSEIVKLTIGVPQGSVLEPLLFLIYMLPIKRILAK